MKLHKFFFLFLFLVITFQVSFSQEKESVLIDEFPRTNCDELLSRVAGYLEVLKNEPNSTGYIIVYGGKQEHLQNLRYEQLMKDSVKVVKFDISRIVFIQGKSEENIRIQLWKVPVGADNPAYTEGKWSYKLSKIKKPFIFYAKSWEDTICPPTEDVELYSKLLLTNSNLRGHLVIRENSEKAFHKTKEGLLQELSDNKVPRKNIRFFYAKAKEFSDIEYWLVPQRRK